MTERDAFTIAEEFAGADFNEERLEKRFRKTMGTLSKDPQKSIYGSSATGIPNLKIIAANMKKRIEKRAFSI